MNLEQFIEALDQKRTIYYQRTFPTLTAPKLVMTQGKKYAKIYEPKGGVYCFVDLTNGDILKAAGWSKPAKHARGNINDPDPTAKCGPYGPEYLR